MGDELTPAPGGIRVFRDTFGNYQFDLDYNQCTIYDLYLTGLTILAGGAVGLDVDNEITIGSEWGNKLNSLWTYYFGLGTGGYFRSDLRFDPLNDRSLFIGKDEDGSLPMASGEFRGKMIRVEGGIGAADKLYCCMKKANESYEWVQVATG